MIFGVLFFAACCTRGYAEEGRLVIISEGITMVLDDSRLVKAALPEAGMAFEDSLLARSALLPHVSASVTENFLSHQPMSRAGSQIIPTGEKQSLSYGIAVYQTLFDFGKSLSFFKAAAELMNVSKARIESVKKLAVLEFIVAYFDVLEIEKMISVAEKEVESISAYLRDIEHLYEQGAVIKNDLLPAKVKLAETKQRLITSRNIKSAADARLNTILSLPIRGKIKVQDIVMEMPQVPEIEAAWQTAEAQRPEIQLINSQLRASFLSEKAKAAENYPRVFADGGYAYTENTYQVHQDNAYLQVGAKVDLYEGGAAKAALFKERMKQEQLLEQKSKLIEDIKLEIEDSWYSFKNAVEKTVVAREAVAEAEENVRVNRVKYNEGAATPSEVLEAIASQTGAQTNYYNADYEVKRNYAKLMYSMGIDLALIYDTMKRVDDGAKKQ